MLGLVYVSFLCRKWFSRLVRRISRRKVSRMLVILLLVNICSDRLICWLRLLVLMKFIIIEVWIVYF